MPLPGNVSLVTVTGTFVFPDDTYPTGTVEFRVAGDPWLKDAGADTTILPKTVSCSVNGAGQIVGPAGAVGAGGVGVKLPATDDTDLAPNGFVYNVTLKFGGLPEKTYSIALPATPSTVDLADLAPVTPVGGGAGLVLSVNGKSPDGSGLVTLVPGDIGAISQAAADARYRPAPVALTDQATLTTDASLSSVFRVTLGGNRTLANPTNPFDGQVVEWHFVQDTVGGRGISLGDKFRLPADLPAVNLSAGAGARDVLTAEYVSGSDIWLIKDLKRYSATPAQLAPGERAGTNNVGYLGDIAALTVLNIGDPTPSGSFWDGPVLRVNTDDFVLDGYLVNAGIDIYNDGAIVKNCVVDVPAGLGIIYGINSRSGELTVQDTTVIGPSDGSAAIAVFDTSSTFGTIKRCDLSGFEDGIVCKGATLVSQCYIHDLDLDPSAHADLIQYYGGTGLTVEHCYLANEDVAAGNAPAGNGQNSCITLDTPSGSTTANPTINNCFMRGGVYYFRCEELSGTPDGVITGLSATNNNFGSVVAPASGEIAVVVTSITAWSNNRKSDNTLIPSP
ncbi:hypothetical protein Lesp02_70790 [Lentzea sp. NBRC 105346]|uniref:hypothetical protein n=1 Tax=Lentzea sp. NBRC 105346 TaxID=3032205 RepID=UPI0024A1BB20|nr:hypothetical protein [Lentzea sp. NBRC 105346]GLZ34892.1 hypothetical protein Lesp02_70790 [Lentzea sp. NBRC 105346]